MSFKLCNDVAENKNSNSDADEARTTVQVNLATLVINDGGDGGDISNCNSLNS